ncbi:MAG TPA: hypothetical protein PKD26_02765 [Pyrinomonadaceae bacterium]|nr:hypothetical protein [Pyrinomonadaceae bacterium]
MSFLLAFLFLAVSINAQPQTKMDGGKGEKAASAPLQLAEKAIAAHGGDKFRGMQTMVVKGSVDVTTSTIPQAIPATFSIVLAGEKYRIEIENQFQPLKQVYDGTQTSSSIRGGFTLPPVNRLGLPMLQQIGKQGFIITALPDGKKKRTGFRMTSPEGYFTDFYLDEKTSQVKAFDSSYTVSGRTVTTSVEIDKTRLVEGVLLPERYSQRFDIEQMIVYANFRAREILVNTAVGNEVFSLSE